MNTSNEQPRPGTVGVAAGEIPARGGYGTFYHDSARAVNPGPWEQIKRQAAERVAYHEVQAAYHLERAARHARILAALRGVIDGQQ